MRLHRAPNWIGIRRRYRFCAAIPSVAVIVRAFQFAARKGGGDMTQRDTANRPAARITMSASMPPTAWFAQMINLSATLTSRLNHQKHF